MQDTMDKIQYIGYSNGVAYPLYNVRLDDNIGLCNVEGCTLAVWCTFDKIIKL
jgi:hypothetical protein